MYPGHQSPLLHSFDSTMHGRNQTILTWFRNSEQMHWQYLVYAKLKFH